MDVAGEVFFYVKMVVLVYLMDFVGVLMDSVELYAQTVNYYFRILFMCIYLIFILKVTSTTPASTTTRSVSTTTSNKIANSNFTEYGTLKRTLNGTSTVFSLTTLPNGDLVSGLHQQIQIWKPNDGTLKWTLTGHTNYVYALTTLPNSDLASGSYDFTIKIWNKGS